jgi:hypothetical protein
MTDYNELLERLDRCQRLEFARAAPYGVLPSRLHAEAATAIRTLLAERQAGWNEAIEAAAKVAESETGYTTVTPFVHRSRLVAAIRALKQAEGER